MTLGVTRGNESCVKLGELWTKVKHIHRGGFLSFQLKMGQRRKEGFDLRKQVANEQCYLVRRYKYTD